MSKYDSRPQSAPHIFVSQARRAVIRLVVLGLFGVLASPGSASTVPFSDDFTYTDGTDLNGSNGWTVVGSGSATVTNGTAEIVDASLTNFFSNSETDVWTDLRLIPVFGDDSTTNVPAGSAFAFYINTSSNVVAYNGTSTQVLSTVVTAGAWTRFTVHSDYAVTNWDLYVDGALAAEDLDFYDSGAADYDGFGVVAEGVATTTTVDDVYITLVPSNAVQPKVTFDATSLNVAESIGTATGSVSLSWAYEATAEVNVIVFGGTATTASDYGYTNVTLSFATGETNKTFEFAIYDDAVGEIAETIFFGFDTFSACSAGAITNFTATIDPDPIDVPLVQFESATVSYNESDGAQIVTVALSAVNSLATATVHHVVLAAGTTAIDPTDYTYTPGVISFDPGETNKTFSFTIQEDSEGEGDETIVFGLQYFTNSLPGTITNLTVTILEDPSDWTLPFFETFEDRTIGDLDGQYGWDAQDAEVQSANAYAGTQAGSVTSATGYARHPFAGTETDVWTEMLVQPVFDGGSTTNPPAGSSFAFYVNGGGNVVVYNGTSTQTLATTVIENEWTRFAVHSDYNATNWALYVDGALAIENLTFYDTNATAFTEFGLIAGAGESNAPVDNVSITLSPSTNVQPTASFVVAATNYAEYAGIVTGYVNLAWSYSGTAEVNIVVFGGTADNGSDYGFNTQTLSFDPGITSQSFTLSISNDVVSEVAETIFLGFDNFSECSAGDTTNSTITIDIDPLDSALPDINFTIGALAVAESVGTLTATVQLSSAYGGTVTVSHAVSPASTATLGQDYNGYTPGVFSFDPGEQIKTFNFTILNDTSNELAETIVFTLGGITNATPIVPTNLTVTIGIDNGDWSLPFYETYEARTPGDLNGQYGWSAVDGIVQTATTYAGSQAGGITSDTGRAYHVFADAQTDVWTELYIQPVFDGGAVTSAPAGSSFAFFVNASGDVVVFNGTSTQTVSAAIQENTWVNFIVHSDYATTNWDLYVGGSLLIGDLDFYDSSASYSEFGIENGGGASNAPVDNVSITLTRPASLPPTLSFDVASASYAENAGTGTGTVSLSWTFAGTATADVVVKGSSTATGGATDYTYSTTPLTFLTGESNKTFTFSITDDSDPEGAETIVFGLTNFVNGSAGVVDTFTATIQDDGSDWSLPFAETFESRTVGDLNGQNGWQATSADVQTGTVKLGAQAASITVSNGIAYHPFGDERTNVWTDVWLQPKFFAAGTPTPPVDSTFVFYVDGSGFVVVFDGVSTETLTWPVLTNGEWARFTVHSDYTTKKWELYVNREFAGGDYDFFNAATASYSEFGVSGAGTAQEAYFDQLNITLDQPFQQKPSVFTIR